MRTDIHIALYWFASIVIVWQRLLDIAFSSSLFSQRYLQDQERYDDDLYKDDEGDDDDIGDDDKEDWFCFLPCSLRRNGRHSGSRTPCPHKLCTAHSRSRQILKIDEFRIYLAVDSYPHHSYVSKVVLLFICIISVLDTEREGAVAKTDMTEHFLREYIVSLLKSNIISTTDQHPAR